VILCGLYTRVVCDSKMDVDATINADNEDQLQVEETDDSCRRDFVEVVPLTRDTDGSCTRTTACISGDWSTEVREVDLTALKQEPDDVRCTVCLIFSLSQQKELIPVVGNRSHSGTMHLLGCISVLRT